MFSLLTIKAVMKSSGDGTQLCFALKYGTVGGFIQAVSLLEKAGISETILNTLNLEGKSNLLSQ